MPTLDKGYRIRVWAGGAALLMSMALNVYFLQAGLDRSEGSEGAGRVLQTSPSSVAREAGHGKEKTTVVVSYTEDIEFMLHTLRSAHVPYEALRRAVENALGLKYGKAAGSLAPAQARWRPNPIVPNELSETMADLMRLRAAIQSEADRLVGPKPIDAEAKAKFGYLSDRDIAAVQRLAERFNTRYLEDYHARATGRTPAESGKLYEDYVAELRDALSTPEAVQEFLRRSDEAPFSDGKIRNLQNAIAHSRLDVPEADYVTLADATLEARKQGMTAASFQERVAIERKMLQAYRNTLGDEKFVQLLKVLDPVSRMATDLFQVGPLAPGTSAAIDFFFEVRSELGAIDSLRGGPGTSAAAGAAYRKLSSHPLSKSAAVPFQESTLGKRLQLMMAAD